MLFPYIGCGENRDKVRGHGGFFHMGTAMSILTLDQAHCAYHFETVFAGSFNGLHGRGAGSTHVIHDHDPCAFFSEAFDALAGAVLLFGFAYKESVESAAGDGNGYDDWVGAHGESTDRVGLPALLADFIEKDLPNQLRAPGVERSGAAVDV